MNIRTRPRADYRFMRTLAVLVGLIAIVLQFLPGWELLSFMLSLAVLGGLIGGTDSYEEPDRQQLARSYKTAYEGLLLVMMAALACLEFLRLLPILPEAVNRVNGHWPGLVIATMCVLIGLAGFQRRGGSGSG